MHPSTELQEWLRYIEAIHPSEIDLGLERLRTVSDRLLTRQAPWVFTVGGTNGKGTTSAAIAALCQAAGQSVGLYTSPHLFSFNERVRINKTPVTDAQLVDAFDAVERARGDVSLSYFEYTTLAAFAIFQEADLDVWVLEVGLGGRLDAVNIIDPSVSVITNVGLDHQGFLGDTVEVIGREKAGICRAGKPVVLGSADMPSSVIEFATSIGACVYPYGVDHGTDDDGLFWQRGQLDSTAPSLPVANAATAAQAFSLGPWSLTDEQVYEALNNFSVVGRLQTFNKAGRTVVVDVGHNPHAGHYLASRFQPEKYHILLGMLEDKDSKGFQQALQPVAQSFSTLSLNVHRGLSASALAQRLEQPVWQQVDQIADYFDQIRSLPGNEPLFIGGSFYTVCAAIEFLES